MLQPDRSQRGENLLKAWSYLLQAQEKLPKVHLQKKNIHTAEMFTESNRLVAVLQVLIEYPITIFRPWVRFYMVGERETYGGRMREYFVLLTKVFVQFEYGCHVSTSGWRSRVRNQK